MKEKDKWKYSDKNLNFLNSAMTLEQQEMLDIIEKSKKQELIDAFDTTIKYKFDLYKKYLFENNLFLFRELEYNIKESVYCLMIGANTASITNTNLILERAIKLALIQHQAGSLANYNDNEIIEKYIKSDKAYSGEDLGTNIQKCQKFKILNEEEAKELKQHKIKYRDGFSHFTPKTILKGENSLINVPDIIDPNLEKYLSMPTDQGAQVRQFAINNAEEHLKYVLKIINHLQYKVLEKFSENNKTCR